MRIIITGATGFLGKALCRELTEHGHEVTAVVRPESLEKAQCLKIKNVIPLPLEDLERLKDLENIKKREVPSGASQAGYDVFFHLAWNGSGGEAREDYGTQLENLRYMEKALKAAKSCGCTKFIGAGSQAEYGAVHGKAREDATVPAPFMMYGAAKLACLHMGRVLAGQLGITFVWPRIYSVYGPRENDPTLLGYVARTLREGKTPELSACENMWDFLYITDFTKAMRLLAENPEAEGVYHVASGDARKLKEFVELERDVIKPGAELNFGARKADEKRTFWLEPDVSRIEGLGFRCEVSFSQGIRCL
jgi:UDP-glucose 4-epimerase